MRVLFVGVCDVSWSTNVPMAGALTAMGHEVDVFNYRTISACFAPRYPARVPIAFALNKIGSVLRRYPRLPAGRNLYFRIAGRGEMNRQLREKVRTGRYDLVFLSKTDAVDYAALDEINRHSRSWYFFMDPVDTARRMAAREYAMRATWASATFSDIADDFKRHGANATWLIQGVDPEVFSPSPGNLTPAKKYDVLFVGSRTPKRQRLVEQAAGMGLEITCFGPGWPNKPVYGPGLADLYRSSKVVLNFCQQGAGFSVRAVQVMACGAFLLSEHCPDLDRFFKCGTHLDCFRTTGELVALARRYVAEEDRREAIADAGCHLVLANHTWHQVMETVMNTVVAGDGRGRGG